MAAIIAHTIDKWGRRCTDKQVEQRDTNRFQMHIWQPQ